MKSLRFAVACGLALLLSSCDAPRPQEYILGRWEDKDHNPLEFRRDGGVIGALQVGKVILTVDGKYRFVDEQTLEVESTGAQSTKRITTFKIDRLDYRELHLSAPNGMMTIWNRPEDQ
jgi:hypothetical protein